MSYYGKQVYIVTRFTNPNTNYKRHMVNDVGKPLCGAYKRSHGTFVYTDEPCDCKRCVKAILENSFQEGRISPRPNDWGILR